ncbi:MAG TPA: PDZ domain-containing protein [Pirellulales bacterium]|nr:PDZ domain-containing protein [Pirellulales bacterium]
MTEPRSLFEKRSIAPQSFKTAFRLPVPNEPIDAPFWLSIGVKGSAPLSVKSLTVSGRLTPLFGVGIDVRGDTVFVSKVVAKSLAESAGVAEGDVVQIINGEAPKSLKEAMSLLGKVAFGETATLVVRRAGVEKTIQIKCE